MHLMVNFLFCVFILVEKTCTDGEFQCDDGSCILETWQCDTHNDCANGEDEHEALCVRPGNQI